MNERIKELVRQATETIVLDRKKSAIEYATEIVFNKEKFAQLIIKECTGICDQQGRAGWNDDRKAQAKLDRDLIREHFGVEE